MGWGDYVRNQIEKILLSEGFSVPVAQGGRGTERTYTTECLRQLKKGRFSMMHYGTVGCGQESRNYLLKRKKKNAVRQSSSKGCSEKGESRSGRTLTAFYAN